MNPKDKHADWLLKPTANDLANELDRMLKAIGLTGNRIPTILRQQEVEIKRITSKYEEMLRQQQDEIETLKANRKHDFGLGEASGFIKGHKENPYKAITNTKIEPTVVSYTHPVKELTDFEIMQISAGYPDRLYFARAILKKGAREMKIYDIAKPIMLSFLAQDQYDSILHEGHIKFDGKNIIYADLDGNEKESITTNNAINIFLERGDINERK